MTQISSYYASVGLQIEQGSIAKLDRYLKQIRGRFNNLQKSLSSSSNIQVTARLNVSRTHAMLNRALRQSSRGLNLDLTNLNISRTNLSRRIQEGISGINKGSALELDVKISESSLSFMKNQVTQALNSLSVSPTIRPNMMMAPVSSGIKSGAMQAATQAGDAVGYRYLYRMRKVEEQSGTLRGRLSAFFQRLMLVGHYKGLVHGDTLRKYMGDGPRQFISRRPVSPGDPALRGRRGAVEYPGGQYQGGRSWGGGREPGGGWDKTRRVSPHSRRNFNPWYNPMLVGGSLGAFLRYGPYSLPFVAGAMGTSAMASRATDIQNARAILDVALQGREAGGQHYDFLSRLGTQLGFRPEDVARPYSKWISSSRGTSFERHVPQSFRGLMEYAATRRLDGGSLADFMSRIISSGRVRSSDLDALTTSGMDIAWQAMADAISGGDREALRELLKGGGVSAEDALPKFFAVLRRESRDYLDDVYTSIDRSRGKAASQSSKWFETMMGGELEGSLSRFYLAIAQITGESEGGAAAVGKILATATDALTASMLGLKEVVDYLRGQEQKDNFLVKYFGGSVENKLLNQQRESLDRIRNTFQMIFDIVDKLENTKIFGFLGAIGRGIRETYIKTLLAPFEVGAQAVKVWEGAAALTTGQWSYLQAQNRAREAGELEDFRAKYPTSSSFYQDPSNRIDWQGWARRVEGMNFAIAAPSGAVADFSSLPPRESGQNTLKVDVSGSIDLGDLGTIGDDPATRERMRLITTEVLVDAMLNTTRQAPKNVVN